MKKTLFVFIFTFVVSAGYGYPMISGMQTDQLLSAPIIVVGKINWVTNSGKSIIKDTIRGHGDVPADVFEIGITVDRFIKGEAESSIHVGGLLTPSDFANFGYLYRDQIPNSASKNQNVFFLSPGKDASKYIPTFPKEFAIEIERNSGIETNSPIEMLRAIAKANVEATNYVLAVRWAEFLSGLHDDFSYWTNKTRDARILIKSTAYATLVQNFPKTPGLRADLIKYLSNPIPSVEDSDVWMANYSLIKSLSKLFEQDPPKDVEIESLLKSGDRNVVKMALGLVKDANHKQIAVDIVKLMSTTKNRDIQYECIKALYALAGDQHLISKPTFMEKPDYYMEEWKKKISGSEN